MRFGKARRIHLVGIGGSGMSGIAEVLINLRYEVSGSDLAESAVTRRLRRLGGRILTGHAPEHIGDADVVVTSTAVRQDNPEVAAARERGVPVIPRAEMLAELMRMKSGIAVAGTHGKTSVTSMVAQVLHLAGLDPTIVIGGRLGILGSSAKLGRGELMVVEADESDGSFLMLRPRTAVITNIDREHLDHHGDMDHLVEAFAAFAVSVPFYGQIVLCWDDPLLRAMRPRLARRTVTYGLRAGADLQATKLEFDGFTSRFSVQSPRGELGKMTLRAPGRHQVVNALAALAIGLDCNIAFKEIAGALESFAGADRRFQKKGETQGILVVDDYGHHPTEIRATLQAARAGWPQRRIIVVFQPHRYTRVRDLLDEFGRCFEAADEVLVTDLYPAGEDPIPGIDARLVADRIRASGHPHVQPAGPLEEVPQLLCDLARSGDLIITLGAGSVTRLGDRFLDLLRSRGAA